MEQKIKFIIVGLIAILAISLIINLQIYSAKHRIEQERNSLKKENTSLLAKIEESLRDNRRMQDRVNALSRDLDKASQEKEEVQKKYELVTKEKEELIEKLKRQPPTLTEMQRPESLSPTEDAYWAGILKAKTDLELQLENVRSELKTAQINNEQLLRDKSTLELDINNSSRESQDLKRQLEYNQKLMDSIAQELVRERNDKFQIQESIKLIKSENNILRRQLKSLNNRKINLERKLAELEKENVHFESRFTEMDALLRDRMLQIDNLKKEVEKSQTTKTTSEAKEESIELPPIIVRPQTESLTSEMSPLQGKILALNKDNNFVIIDLGEDSGIKVGDRFQVYREDQSIATIEVVSSRKTIAACDIKKETTPIKVGDAVR